MFTNLLSILWEEDFCASQDIVRDDDTSKIVKLYDKAGNEVTLTHFLTNNKSTIMLQGKPYLLFSICAANMAELIENQINIEALNSFYGTHVTKDEIEKEYDEIFINSKKYINEKLKRCICQ